MINPSLGELALFRELCKRKDPTSLTLAGMLHPVAESAAQLLEFVRLSCPEFTDHSVRHSLRILDAIARILSPACFKKLTSAEIFALVVAALFHDVGMVAHDGATPVAARSDHHVRSGQILATFAATKLDPIAEHRDRLVEILRFVIEAHGLTWREMAARPHFTRASTVLGQDVRPVILAILLRVGDLLDMDANRTSESMRRCFAGLFNDPTSKEHHDRHANLKDLHLSTAEIRAQAITANATQHRLWAQWFEYLRSDILAANTYVFVDQLGDFRLPAPTLSVEPAADARYDVWPLRFEIDDSGRIWDVISRSIYTGKHDYVRELIQNAIDADLSVAYRDRSVSIQKPSPRTWGHDQHRVLVLFSARKKALYIVDHGIGMTRDTLERFLFRVAESGYRPTTTDGRSFPFPAIAKFGVGFVSVLTRASRVSIITQADGDEGRLVQISNGSREAYVEKHTRPERGTCIALELKDVESLSNLEDFVTGTFWYPSVPLLLCDLDLLAAQLEGYGKTVPPPATLVAFARNPEAAKTSDGPHAASEHAQWLSAVDPRQKERGQYDIPFRTIDNPTLTRGDKVQGPLLFEVNGDIEIARIRPLAEPVNRRFRGVLWVPVAFTDGDAGIEWSSLHGFILVGRQLKATLYGGPAKMTLEMMETARRLASAKEPRLDRRMMRAGSEPEDGEELYLIDPSQEPARSADDAVAAGELLALRSSGDRFALLGRSEDEEYASYHVEFMDPNGLSLAGRSRGLASTKGARQVEAAFTAVSTHYEELTNFVFQDGIQLPLSALSICPLGVSRGLVNLTASSRLPLNVARNAIDESPELLNQWVAETAARIQRRVLDAVARALDVAKVKVQGNDEKALLACAARSDELYPRCRRQILELARQSSLVTT